MSRITLALIATLVAMSPAAAQQAAETSTPSASSTPSVTIDPRASLAVQPKQQTMLTGLYATQATLDLCAIAPTEPATINMNAHRRQLETGLGLDEAAGEKAYQAVRSDLEKAGVDCTETSPDRQQTDAVLAVYSGQK